MKRGVLAWLVAVGGLVAYEGYALATGDQTLSRAVVEMTEAWPLLPAAVGVVVGALLAHFWWPWDRRPR